MEETKERLGYIDAAKGFSMIFIILVHLIKNDAIHSIALTFNVPIFFVISGFLMKYKEKQNGRQRIVDIAKNGVKTLMIPYYFFSLIALIVITITTSSMDFVKIVAKCIFTLYGYFAMWFLPILFATRILFACIQRIKFKWIKALILIFPIIYFVFLRTGKMNILMYLIERTIMGLFFYAGGYYLYNYINNTKIPTIILIGTIILVNICALYNGEFQIFNLYSNNFAISMFTSIIQCVCIIMLFKRLPTSKLLSFLGKNSMIILGTHQTAMELLTWYLRYMKPNLKIIAFAITFIIVEYLSIKILNKFWKCQKFCVYIIFGTKKGRD